MTTELSASYLSALSEDDANRQQYANDCFDAILHKDMPYYFGKYQKHTHDYTPNDVTSWISASIQNFQSALPRTITHITTRDNETIPLRQALTILEQANTIHNLETQYLTKDLVQDTRQDRVRCYDKLAIMIKETINSDAIQDLKNTVDQTIRIASRTTMNIRYIGSSSQLNDIQTELAEQTNQIDKHITDKKRVLDTLRAFRNQGHKFSGIEQIERQNLQNLETLKTAITTADRDLQEVASSLLTDNTEAKAVEETQASPAKSSVWAAVLAFLRALFCCLFCKSDDAKEDKESLSSNTRVTQKLVQV